MSWGIALFEYALQVPAIRIGSTQLELGQLETRQEVITLGVVVPVAARGCPASEVVRADGREGRLREGGVREVRINVGWNPPWRVARVPEAERDAIESWGLAV